MSFIAEQNEEDLFEIDFSVSCIELIENDLIYRSYDTCICIQDQNKNS